MALLLSCESISKSYGADPLFEEISLAVSEGDRVGLIGPNGSGKSTLLQILAGLREPDAGTVSVRKLVRTSYVPQDTDFAPGVTIREVLDEALQGTSLEEQHKIARLATMQGTFALPPLDTPAESLSGGWKRRLSIARGLVSDPDLLFLDEPTNHLDLEGILLLERLLKGSAFACIVVSHDRYFLENVATGMAELSRAYPGGMFRVAGNYSGFLERKQQFLTAQSREQETLENKVRREIEWLRRGPKARTTKAKARIDAAGRLMDQLADLTARSATSSAQIDFTATERRTKRLVECEKVEKTLGGRLLFRGLDLVLSPGTRMGIAGRNGTGKTTLLRLLKGEIEPDAGSIRRADLLRIVYFDQNREQIDPDVTLRRALAPEGDSVMYRDRPIHVMGWARRFLFQSEQLELPVRRLSGGERARVLIARLMLQPADLLLLDEPTNDLDIPTLEVLEESLTDFPGALGLVTHDRYMLDRVSTAVLGLDGEGGAALYADYSQWEQAQAAQVKARPVKDTTEARPAATSAQTKKRLSYLEQREWDAMEQNILDAETAVAEKQAVFDSASASGDPKRIQAAYDELTAAQQDVERLYHRWSELEAKQA
jgi:ABC transport system ATP-binding/permease protein